MRLIISFLLAALIVSCAAPPARSQSNLLVVDTCGTLPLAYLPGAVRTGTQDKNGLACSAAVVSTAGLATSANQTLQITQETAINTLLGLQADAACATDNGSCTLAALVKRLNQRLTTINTTLGSPIQATGGTVGLVAGVAEIGNVKNSGTFAVQATLTAETTKVIGTVNQGTSPWVDNISQINGVTPLMGNGVTGTGSQRITVASDNTPFSVKIDQTTPGTTNAVSLAQIGGTTIVNGGVAGSQSVGGTVATNVAITANPLNLGAQAVSSENTAVTTARQVQLVADLVGKLIVLPYANPENFVSGAITSAMTGTTSTSLIAAPAAGLRNYITQCTFSNSHATVGTDIILQDGSGGTTLYTAPAAPAYGGAVIVFPTPLRQPTTATALFVANVTTGSNTKASCSGYKGA